MQNRKVPTQSGCSSKHSTYACSIVTINPPGVMCTESAQRRSCWAAPPAWWVLLSLWALELLECWLVALCLCGEGVPPGLGWFVKVRPWLAAAGS